MSTSTCTPTIPSRPSSDLSTFHTHITSTPNPRVLALLGAGLSASSGLPTFRGPNGLWRSHNPLHLATRQAFTSNPSLVWHFYSHRRHMALNVLPNPAHHALATYARRNPNFLTISQNVDGLSPRAGHPADQLMLLHGSLFDVKCSNETCEYIEQNNFTDPIVESLTTPQNISDPDQPLPVIPISSLPTCPKCSALLRPGVVWFGESLPTSVLHHINKYITTSEPIDLMLVIGTSGTVYPAAAYVDIARQNGARIAVVNPDPGSMEGLTGEDWWFGGDAAEVVPWMVGVSGEGHGAAGNANSGNGVGNVI